MMLTNFEQTNLTKEQLHGLSTKQASELFSKYNIYFQITISTEYYAKFIHQFDFDDKYKYINKLDPLKDFSQQCKEIYQIANNYFDSILFYTDYIESPALVTRRLEEAHNHLLQKSKSITLTNLKKETKMKPEQINAYLESLEIGTQRVFSFG